MGYWDISKTNSLVVGNHLHRDDVLGWIVSLPPNPGPENMTLFGNRIFADVIKYRWGPTGLGWS